MTAVEQIMNELRKEIRDILVSQIIFGVVPPNMSQSKWDDHYGDVAEKFSDVAILQSKPYLALIAPLILTPSFADSAVDKLIASIGVLTLFRQNDDANEKVADYAFEHRAEYANFLRELIKFVR